MWINMEKNSAVLRLPAGKQLSLPWSAWNGKSRTYRNAVWCRLICATVFFCPFCIRAGNWFSILWTEIWRRREKSCFVWRFRMMPVLFLFIHIMERILAQDFEDSLRFSEKKGFWWWKMWPSLIIWTMRVRMPILWWGACGNGMRFPMAALWFPICLWRRMYWNRERNMQDSGWFPLSRNGNICRKRRDGQEAPWLLDGCQRNRSISSKTGRWRMRSTAIRVYVACHVYLRRFFPRWTRRRHAGRGRKITIRCMTVSAVWKGSGRCFSERKRRRHSTCRFMRRSGTAYSGFWQNTVFTPRYSGRWERRTGKFWEGTRPIFLSTCLRCPLISDMEMRRWSRLRKFSLYMKNSL